MFQMCILPPSSELDNGPDHKRLMMEAVHTSEISELQLDYRTLHPR
jgi:hypothetical protein